MTQYRKKPVVIDAYQFHNRVGADDRPDWIIKAFDAGAIAVWQPRDKPAYMIIPTLEGEMRADVDDWIIRGIKGELYPCKPDIFAATYEPVGADHDR